MTTMPAATPMERVSTTAVRMPSTCEATRRAVSQVAERPEEMPTNTAESQPSSRACSKAPRMASGEGRLVVGTSTARRSTMSFSEMSTPAR